MQLERLAWVTVQLGMQCQRYKWMERPNPASLVGQWQHTGKMMRNCLNICVTIYRQGFPSRANARPRRSVWLKMEKGRKKARRTGPLGCTWFRMVVYFWLNLNLNRSAKNSFENKIRIWNLCSVFLVHLSTPKPATLTPLNRLLQRRLLFLSLPSLLLLWTPRRGLGTNARLWSPVGHNARWRIRNCRLATRYRNGSDL